MSIIIQIHFKVRKVDNVGRCRREEIMRRKENSKIVDVNEM